MVPMRLSWTKKVAIAGEALVLMAHSRLILYRTRPDHVIARNAAAERCVGISEAIEARHCAEIAFIVPRLAQKLPWRSDCLVQAIAAQQMLARRGVVSKITVGVTKYTNRTMEAHAWLSCGDAVILGGDIARFAAILGCGTRDSSRP